MSNYQSLLFSAHYHFQRSAKYLEVFKLVDHKEIYQTKFLNRFEKEIRISEDSSGDLTTTKRWVRSQIKFKPIKGIYNRDPKEKGPQRKHNIGRSFRRECSLNCVIR